MKRFFNVSMLFAVVSLIVVSCGDGKSSNDSVCGDGKISGSEKCDIVNLDGETCESLGFGAGTLNCESNCMDFDTSQCGASATCGDNQIDGTDVCDGSDLGGETCETQGFQEGTLKCQSNCAGFDTSQCGASASCGDENIDSGEVCDGKNLNGRTCEDEGFEQGDLACSSDCRSFDTSDCYTPCNPECGDRVCGPDPVCGESCGECTGDWEICNSAGQCEETCDLEPVTENKVLDIDLETFTVSGKVTLNGLTMPGNTKEYYEEETRGSIIFRNTDSNDSYYISIGSSGEATFNVTLFKGTYDVSFNPNSSSYQDVLPDLNMNLESGVLVEGTLMKNFNLETVQVSGELTINNAQMPDNTKEYYETESRGGLYFTNADSGDSYYISINSTGKASFSEEIFKGTYNVSFNPNNESYQNAVPDLNMKLEEGLVINDTLMKTFNLDTARVSGIISLNGTTMPNNTKEYYETESRGGVSLANADSGDSIYISIGAAGQGEYSAKIYKGTYNISFSPNNSSYQNVLPDLNLKLEDNVVINDTTSKNYNLQTAQISGKINLNGDTMPNNTKAYYETEARGGVVVKNRESGDDLYISINASGTASYNATVFKGSYDISFNPNSSSYQDVLPDLNMKLEKEVSVQDTTIKNYNLETANISGTVSLNGNTMPNNAKEYYETEARGGLNFKNKESGDSVYISLGSSGEAAFDVELFKGTYDVTLNPNSESYQDVLPDIELFLDSKVDVTSTVTRNYSLKTVTVSGGVTLNGKTMPSNTKEYYETEIRGSLIFTNKSTSDRYYVSIGSSGEALYNVTLFEGSYDVSFNPNSESYQNVLPDLQINLLTGCYDYSASCDEDSENITGIWEFVPTASNWKPTTFYLTQNGDTITGTYEVYNASGTIKPGTRTGNYIKFEYDPYYDMIVEGNIVSGCVILGRFDTIGHSGSNYDSDFVATKIE